MILKKNNYFIYVLDHDKKDENPDSSTYIYFTWNKTYRMGK